MAIRKFDMLQSNMYEIAFSYEIKPDNVSLVK